MERSSELMVRLYGEHIGNLKNLGHDITILDFTDSYKNNNNRPTLSLHFKDDLDNQNFKPRTYRSRLIPFFSNLLPEGSLRKYLATKMEVSEHREFYLLEALGADLPGAVTVESYSEKNADMVVDSEISNEINIGNEEGYRFSLAGVQMKFSAIRKSTGGLTIPVSGFGGTWIVKLPSITYKGVPENEYSMMTLAKLVGIKVPKFDLIDSDSVSNLPEEFFNSNSKSLVIERFDRFEGKLVHIEDFAQIFGYYPDRKYGSASFRNILSKIAEKCKKSDIDEFIRRLTFNMLIGNADMHLKNWSLIYYDRVNPTLSPAYDFVSTIAYIPGDTTNIRICDSNKFSNYSTNEIERLSDKVGISRVNSVAIATETTELFLENWSRESKNLPMYNEVRESIEENFKKVPIVKETQRI